MKKKKQKAEEKCGLTGKKIPHNSFLYSQRLPSVYGYSQKQLQLDKQANFFKGNKTISISSPQISKNKLQHVSIMWWMYIRKKNTDQAPE
jgi:hypothetical protein